MKKSELVKLIKETINEDDFKIRQSLEESISDDFSNALQNLISQIEKMEGIDKRSANKTTGELLGIILTPIFQSELIRLEDRKGFYDNFKIGGGK